LVNPFDEISRLLDKTSLLFFSTELFSEKSVPPENWHYYYPESGQHIGFFSRLSLSCLAERLGVYFYSDSYFMHAFSKNKYEDNIFHSPSSGFLKILNGLCKEKSEPQYSYSQEDHQNVVARLKKKHTACE